MTMTEMNDERLARWQPLFEKDETLRPARQTQADINVTAFEWFKREASGDQGHLVVADIAKMTDADEQNDVLFDMISFRFEWLAMLDDHGIRAK